jgi:hypothetical protein
MKYHDFPQDNLATGNRLASDTHATKSTHILGYMRYNDGIIGNANL